MTPAASPLSRWALHLSRRAVTAHGGGEMDEVELLIHYLQADAKDVAVLEKILAWLEHLPLAIDLVRVYISMRRY